ncbi:hypothetical protein EDD15DRAFT_2323449, partial [Pisolithus albus]
VIRLSCKLSILSGFSCTFHELILFLSSRADQLCDMFDGSAYMRWLTATVSKSSPLACQRWNVKVSISGHFSCNAMPRHSVGLKGWSSSS